MLQTWLFWIKDTAHIYTTYPLSSSCFKTLTISCCSRWRATDEDVLTYITGVAPLLSYL